jgi:hypothetical protein
VNLSWEGERQDREAAAAAAARLEEFLEHASGSEIVIANEFAEARIVRVETRNGSRLLIQSPKSGQWVTLDPLELESLTWQGPATFSAMVGHPFRPLIPEGTE